MEKGGNGGGAVAELTGGKGGGVVAELTGKGVGYE